MPTDPAKLKNIHFWTDYHKSSHYKLFDLGICCPVQYCCFNNKAKAINKTHSQETKHPSIVTSDLTKILESIIQGI
jgi:hypothetical protein